MNKKKTSVSAPADGTGNGEIRVDIKERIDKALYQGDTQKAIRLAKRIYKSCKKNSDNPGMAICLKKMAEYYSLDGNLTESVKNYSAALELYKGLDDPESLADINNTLGQFEPDIAKAMDYFNQQLAVLRKAGADRYAISWAYECMARKYEEEGDFRNALVAHSAILEIFERDHTPVMWKVYSEGEEEAWYPDNEMHLAYIWQRMALVNGKMGEYETAFELFNRVLDVCGKNCEFIRSECSTSDVNQNMGDLEMERENYRKALEYYEISLGYEPDKIDSLSDREIRERMTKARQMMNWTERYSKVGGE